MSQRHPDLPESDHTFRHEVLLYSGHRQLVDSLVPFLREGLAAGETTAVLLESDKIALLREALGEDADRVHFTDSAHVGRNPARLIPWWRRFVDEHLRTDRRVRAVGEPGLTGRSPAELDEYFAHEELLNVAFADDPAWSLLCPYDAEVLTSEVLDEFRRSHPFVTDDGKSGPNINYRPTAGPLLDRPLDAPPADAHQMTFERDRDALRRARAAVLDHARRCGLDAAAADHLVLAANELVTNSIEHGGGTGTLRLWREDEAAVCEVTDTGGVLIGPPLLGRVPPALDHAGGRGLWMANQLCDLVQVRSSPTGTTVRLHMWTSPSAADPD